MAATVDVFDSLHSGPLHCVELDYFATRLATASSDHTIRLWQVHPQSDGGQQQALQPSPGSLTQELQRGSAAERGLGGGAGTRAEPMATLLQELHAHEGPVWQVRWAHPSFGSILASCGYDRRIVVWEQEREERGWGGWDAEDDLDDDLDDRLNDDLDDRLNDDLDDDRGDVLDHLGQFTPKVDIAATVGNSPASNPFVPVYSNEDHAASVNALAFAPPEWGLMLAAGSSDGSISVFTRRAATRARPAYDAAATEASTGGGWTRQAVFSAHFNGVYAVAWAPTFPEEDDTATEEPRGGYAVVNGSSKTPLLASGGADCQVRIWGLDRRINSWTQLHQLKASKPHSDWVRDVAFQPLSAAALLLASSLLLASCSEDGTVKLWVDEPPPHTSSALEKTLHVGSITKTSHWRLRQTLALGAPVWRISWSASGTLLAAARGDNDVVLFRENICGVWEAVSKIAGPSPMQTVPGSQLRQLQEQEASKQQTPQLRGAGQQQTSELQETSERQGLEQQRVHQQELSQQGSQPQTALHEGRVQQEGSQQHELDPHKLQQHGPDPQGLQQHGLDSYGLPQQGPDSHGLQQQGLDPHAPQQHMSQQHMPQQHGLQKHSLVHEQPQVETLQPPSVGQTASEQVLQGAAQRLEQEQDPQQRRFQVYPLDRPPPALDMPLRDPKQHTAHLQPPQQPQAAPSVVSQFSGAHRSPPLSQKPLLAERMSPQGAAGGPPYEDAGVSLSSAAGDLQELRSEPQQAAGAAEPGRAPSPPLSSAQLPATMPQPGGPSGATSTVSPFPPFAASSGPLPPSGGPLHMCAPAGQQGGAQQPQSVHQPPPPLQNSALQLQAPQQQQGRPVAFGVPRAAPPLPPSFISAPFSQSTSDAQPQSLLPLPGGAIQQPRLGGNANPFQAFHEGGAANPGMTRRHILSTAPPVGAGVTPPTSMQQHASPSDGFARQQPTLYTPFKPN